MLFVFAYKAAFEKHTVIVFVLFVKCYKKSHSIVSNYFEVIFIIIIIIISKLFRLFLNRFVLNYFTSTVYLYSASPLQFSVKNCGSLKNFKK